jgi:AcrR family transcriptional regulator
MPVQTAPTPKVPGSQPDGDATAQQFLNAAERLFAANGFDGTSVRAIANESGVNLGALHYYWGSKNALIRAVLERRLKPILAERKRRYTALLEEAGKKPVDIHALLEASLVPALTVPGATAAQRQSFRRLYGQALADRSPHVKGIVDDIYDESSRIFVAALRRCCSHLEDSEFFWRMNCILGSLLYAQLNNGRMAHLSGGQYTGDDVEEGIPHLIQFLAAGMMAPSLRPKGRRKATASAGSPGAR